MPALSPEELEKAIQERELPEIPDEIFQAFNELIGEKMDTNGVAAIHYNDAKRRIGTIQGNTYPSLGKDYDGNEYMNVEPHYHKVGWSVTFSDATLTYRFEKPQANKE